MPVLMFVCPCLCSCLPAQGLLALGSVISIMSVCSCNITYVCVPVQGLLALGSVISALGDMSKKGSHVPYRDSRHVCVHLFVPVQGLVELESVLNGVDLCGRHII